MSEQVEFEERDIWESSLEIDSDESENDSEKGQGAANEEHTRKRGASSTSSSDSDLDEQLEENIKAFRGPGSGSDSLPIELTPGSFRGRPRSRRASAEEQEFLTSKLGTSMPINIPMMSGRGRRSMEAEKQPDKAATFVPPHLVEQPDVRVGLSLSSASGAKREKLLQRNAILRRTGFLEAGTKLPGGVSGGLPELMDPLNRRMLPIKESHLEPSALSAALGSPDSKQES